MKSKEKKSEKKEIRNDVRRRIKKGEPKQQVLEELRNVYDDKATLIKQIEKTPSNAAKTKYVKYNYLLCGCLLMALILNVLFLFKFEPDLGAGERVLLYSTLLSIVLDVVFIVGVLMYFIEIYSWIAARALLTLMTLLISFGYFKTEIHLFVYLSFALIIVSFTLGLLLGVKLCPQRVPKIVEVEIDETEKIKKTVYVFPD